VSDRLSQGIGILSRLLVEYENNPFEARLERNTPVYNTVQCVGKYIQNIPSVLRDLIEASAYSDTALYQLQAVLIKDTALRALIGTTQAISLFRGGVKANAMPEEAWAVVNHRIATQRSVFCIEISSNSCCPFALLMPIL
jgi:Gly-Xaa carboxypeptidase